MNTPENIYPIFNRMLTRQDKEQLLGQHGVMLWFTGLSGSGKSTIAIALERELHQRGFLCRILDGDNIRTGINANLGFSPEDRRENIRRIAQVGKLFVDTGIITIAAFISPTEELRQMAASIIGADDFKEIYISTPLSICEERDVKGLYARARRGEVKNFTGISAPFESPLHPALTLDTSKLTVEQSVSKLLELLGVSAKSTSHLHHLISEVDNNQADTSTQCTTPLVKSSAANSITISSLSQINQAAQTFLSLKGQSTIFALYGKMGVGKTTFIKALCQELGVTDTVNSPTFSIVNEYRSASTNQLIYHFDFYRIKNLSEVYDMGYEDYFYSGALCFIEWPELIEDLLPADTLRVNISEEPNGTRIITLSK